MSEIQSIELQDPERLGLPSASKMEIVVACPGQNNLVRSLPPERLKDEKPDYEERLWAERGTRIHDAFETGNTLSLDAEEHSTYTQALAYSEAIKQKWIEDKALDPALIMEGPRELRVWLTAPWSFPNPIGSAKLDRHWIYRDKDRCCLLIQDLKSGFNPNLPPSAHSWQMRYQAVVLWKEEYDGVTDARVAYVKAKDKCERGDYADYSEQDLKYSFESIAFHSWESTQPDAPRHASTACRWCPCKADCPEALAYALLPSQIIKGVKPRSKESAAERTALASLDDLYRLWEGGSTIRSILDAVTERLKSMTDEQLAEIALTHGKGRPMLAWDTKGAFELLRDKKLWPEEEIWKCLDPILGRLGVMAQTQLGVDEKYASDSVKELLAEFITTTEGSPTLKKLR